MGIGNLGYLWDMVVEEMCNFVFNFFKENFDISLK